MKTSPATSGDEVETLAYIYTDRPIYRPGDMVYYKGIVRDTNYGRYNLPSLDSLELRLGSFSFFGGDSFERTFTVAVEPDGSFSGEYQLPDDLSLGSYQLFVQSSTVEAFRQFTVAEYRAPEFLVSLTPAEPEQLLGFVSMVKLSVNVDHVATLRQARRAAYPDPLAAARLAEAAAKVEPARYDALAQTDPRPARAC